MGATNDTPFPLYVEPGPLPGHPHLGDPLCCRSDVECGQASSAIGNVSAIRPSLAPLMNARPPHPVADSLRRALEFPRQLLRRATSEEVDWLDSGALGTLALGRIQRVASKRISIQKFIRGLDETAPGLYEHLTCSAGVARRDRWLRYGSCAPNRAPSPQPTMGKRGSPHRTRWRGRLWRGRPHRLLATRLVQQCAL